MKGLRQLYYFVSTHVRNKPSFPFPNSASANANLLCNLLQG